MSNAAAPVRKISQKFQQKYNDAGMPKVTEFVGELGGVKLLVIDGAASILIEVKRILDEAVSDMKESARHRRSLVPDGANYEEWQKDEVVRKLTDLSKDFEKLSGSLDTVISPVRKIGEAIETESASLEQIVKRLSSITAKLSKISEVIKSSKDIAKIDVAGLSKILTTESKGIVEPLRSLASIHGGLARESEAVNQCVQTLLEFRSRTMGAIKEAFIVPSAYFWLRIACCAREPADIEAPAQSVLLRKVGALNRLPLEGIKADLAKVHDFISSIDAPSIIQPVETYAVSTQGVVKELDALVMKERTAGNGVRR